MSRLQALLLALELSAIVWVGVVLCGEWIIREGDIHLDLGIVSAAR